MDWINELAKQGFGFFLAAGELMVIIYLFKKYVEQLDMRRQDAIQYRDQIKEPMTGLQRTMDAIIAILKEARNNNG